MHADYKKIKRCVEKALNYDMMNFYEDYNLITKNCDAGLKWDFINQNISNKFNSRQYKVILVNRGFWTQIVLYNLGEQRLYFLMNESNFKRVKNDSQRKYLHLIQILGSINEIDKNKVAYDELKNKLPQYMLRVKEYRLITYEYNKNVKEFKYKYRKINSNFDLLDLELDEFNYKVNIF